MKTNKIKALVKHYVKETLVEVLTELHLETLVEGIISERLEKKAPSTLREAAMPTTIQPHQPTFQPPPRQPDFDAREKLRKLAVPDSEWQDIYADTLASGNPILNSSRDGTMTAAEMSGKEEVPQEALEQLGLFRDYSAFIPNSDKPKTQEDEAWAQKLQERAEMLKKNTVIKG